MSKNQSLVPIERIERLILLIRGQRVLLDADLAALYGVTTKALNQAVKRNQKRFPPNFMFRLTYAEKGEVVTNCDHLANLKFSKSLPFAFTEHGAIQAANILNSPQAVKMGVYVVRAFVQVRQLLANHRELATRLNELEEKTEAMSLKQDSFAKNTRVQLKQMFDALRELMQPPEIPKKPIGFVYPDEEVKPSKERTGD